MQRFLAIALLAVHGGNPATVEGSYLAQTMNGQRLPAELHVGTTEGDFRLFRLDQGVLRLSEDGRFTLYFRYHHQLVRRGDRPTATPVLSDGETGTYRIESGRVILTPVKKKKGHAPPQISATIAGDEIRATYLLENGGRSQRVWLSLRRDPSYW